MGQGHPPSRGRVASEGCPTGDAAYLPRAGPGGSSEGPDAGQPLLGATGRAFLPGALPGLGKVHGPTTPVAIHHKACNGARRREDPSPPGPPPQPVAHERPPCSAAEETRHRCHRAGGQHAVGRNVKEPEHPWQPHACPDEPQERLPRLARAMGPLCTV